MASEQEIAEGLEALFRETNPNSYTSVNEVVLRLQSKLGFDLSEKFEFVRAQINLLFTSQPQQPPPPPPPPQQRQQQPPVNVVSRPLPNPVQPNPSSSIAESNHPNLNVSHHPNLNVAHHPNLSPSQSTAESNHPNLNVSHHPNLNAAHHPNLSPSQSTVESNHPNLNVSHHANLNVAHHPNLNMAHHPNLNVAHHPNVSHHPNLNVAHHPNLNVAHHPKVAYHPNSAHLQGRQHVFHSFPGVPTEISFAQPGGSSDLSDTLSSPTTKDSTQKPKRRGGPGGLNKLCGVTPELEAIVGQPEMPRTEIVKQLWAYIRKHNLQDPSNKRKIICNDELRLLFEVDCTDMFQMNKLLAKHIVPLDSTKASGQQSKKLKVEESEVVKSESVPIVISEALANFFGNSEKEMLKSDVYKRIEEYIKAENLEDPSNSMIACDAKLQELLGCQSITASEVREALSRNHLFQKA